MYNFEKNGYEILPHFLEEDSINTVSLYLQHLINQRQSSEVSPENKRGFHNNLNDKYIKELTAYADPLTEIFLKNSLPAIEIVTKTSLYPVVSYAQVLKCGDEIKSPKNHFPYEYTTIINIASKGCPQRLWLETDGMTPVEVMLTAGDAAIIKGCEILCWQDKLINEEDIIVQIVLHYVEAIEKNKRYRFNGRGSLGLLNKI